MTGEPATRALDWVEQFGSETALWLAVPPMWTEQLASAAQLPVDGPLGDTVERATVAGLVQRRLDYDFDLNETRTFWVVPQERAALLDELTSSLGRDHVGKVTAQVAASFWRDPGALPGAAQRWSELAMAAVDRADDGAAIVAEVRTIVLGHQDLADAAELVGAAGALRHLGSPAFATSVARARRLLELGRRQARDRRRLVDYVPQAEHTAAIDGLLDGPPERWALHLVGVGGVGKTTLIRDIAAGDYARRRSIEPFPVAVADFDSISPEYPRYRPLELLFALADELALWADSNVAERSADRFLRFSEAADALAAEGAGADGARMADLVAKATQSFVGLVRDLAEGGTRRVLIVLDTCEELAKFHLGGGVEAVERTFALVEGIAAAAPDLRVLFAGRRYLAREYAGGEMLSPQTAGRMVVSEQARTYLTLTRARGMLRSDARQLVGRPTANGRAMLTPSDDLVEAILGRCPELAGPDYDADPQRFNPYELDVFRQWWVAEPELTADAVRYASAEAYVEGRIARRLAGDPQLVRTLYVAALTGAFDERQLDVGDVGDVAAPVRADGATAPPLADRLAEQEWVEATFLRSIDVREFKVADTLRDKLLSWAAAPARRPVLDAQREQLAAALGEQIGATTPIEEVTTTQLLAALRVVDDPVGLWLTFERRIAGAARWEVLARMLPEIRAEVEPRQDAEPLLAAAVAASQVATQRRVNLQYPADLAAPAALLAAADRSGNSPRPHRLTLGARCRFSEAGGAAALAVLAGADGVTDTSTTDVVDVTDATGAAMVASAPDAFVAAVERVANTLDPNVAIAATFDAPTIERLLTDLPADLALSLAVALRVFVAATAAGEARRRRATATGPLDVALGDDRLDELGRSATERSLAARAATWPDFPEADGRDPRVWLWLHRCAGLHGPAAADASAAELAAAERLGHDALDTLDGERLLSAAISSRLGREVVPAVELDDLAALDADVAARRPPWALAHRRVEPLLLALARSRYVGGAPERAADLLLRRRDVAQGNRQDAVVRDAELGLAWLAVRMRVPTLVPSSVASSVVDVSRAGGSVAGEPAALVLAAAAILQTSLTLRGLVETPNGLTLPDTALGDELRVESTQPRAPLGMLRRRAAEMSAADPLTAVQLRCLLAEAGDAESRAELPGAYARARTRQPDLPLVDDLLRPADGSPRLLVDDLLRSADGSPRLSDDGLKAHPAGVALWDAWLDRIGAALATAGAGPAPTALPAAGAWPDPAAPAATHAPSAPAPPPTSQSGRLRQLWTAASNVAAFVVGLAVFLGVGRFVTWLVGWDLGALTTMGLGVVALGVIASAITVLARLRLWRRAVLRLLRVTVTVDAGSSVDTTARTATLTVAAGPGVDRLLAHAPLRWALAGRVRRVLQRATVTERFDVAPVPVGAPVLGPTTARGLPRGTPVALRLTPADRPLVWERSLADLQSDSTAWFAVFVRETGPARPPQASAGVAYRCPAPWAPALADTYRNGASQAVPAGRDSMVATVPGAARVLHVIGTPTETSSGVVLRTSRPADVLGDRRADLVAVDELGVTRAALVILQGMPYDGPLVAADATEAAAAIDVAEQCVAIGAAAVVVLPALPVALFDAALHRLGRLVANGDQPTNRQLIDLVAALKEAAIGTDLAVTPLDARTVAQDHVVYLPSTLRAQGPT